MVSLEWAGVGCVVVQVPAKEEVGRRNEDSDVVAGSLRARPLKQSSALFGTAPSFHILLLSILLSGEDQTLHNTSPIPVPLLPSPFHRRQMCRNESQIHRIAGLPICRVSQPRTTRTFVPHLLEPKTNTSRINPRDLINNI